MSPDTADLKSNWKWAVFCLNRYRRDQRESQDGNFTYNTYHIDARDAISGPAIFLAFLDETRCSSKIMEIKAAYPTFPARYS